MSTRHNRIANTLVDHTYDTDAPIDGTCSCGAQPVDSVVDHIAREIGRAIDRPPAAPEATS